MLQNKDIVGFGVATLDVICEVNRFPTAGGKERVLSCEAHGGGLTATALVAASKLGASCWYGGPLGDNKMSNQVRSIFHKFGVECCEPGLYPPEAEPLLSNVYLERETGERTILWTDFLTPDPILDESAYKMVASAKCLFVDHYFAKTLLPLYKRVREANIPIVGDFERIESPDVVETITLVDHLILPARFAREYTKENDISTAVMRLLGESRRNAVVITEGTAGAWFAEQGDTSVQHQASFKVQTRDTNGCGDVFHGAYAAGLVFGMNLRDRVRFASAASALKATKVGGQSGAPFRNELDAFLEYTSY